MDGYVTIGTELNTKEFDAQMRHIETKMLDIEDKLKQADMGFEVGDTEKLEAEYERLGNQLLGLKEKQEKYNQSIREAQMAGFNKIKESVDGVGNSLQKVTKRIAKMALAVFGIRSAFMFVRRSIDTIAQGDKQLSDDIEYMKIALAYTIEPIVRGIVNLAKQLMFYIAYIVKAWFGINIFEKANKGLANANKNAKQLQKTLAGFDEMNIIGDNSSNANGIVPSFDLTKPEDYPIPSWLQWILDHKDEVIAGLAGIAGGLAAIALGFKSLQALGIGLAIMGIVYAIENLLKYLKDPTWENFGGILQGIALTVLGIAIAFGLWPLAAMATGMLIVATIIKHWDKIKEIFQKGIDWLASKSDWVGEHFGVVGQMIYDNIVKLLQKTLNFFDMLFNNIRGVFDGLIKFIKGVFTGDWSLAWEGLKQIASNIFGQMLNNLKLLLMTFFGGFSGLVIDQGYNLGFKLGQSLGDAFKDIFKSYLNTILGMTEDMLNKPIKKMNSFIGTINKIPGVNIGKIPEIKIPRLAKGTILNNPGKGVPVAGGSAIAGEAGREAYLPLSNTQLLEELGSTIGKYITIDLTNVTNLDGRQIARKVEQINQNNRFVLNR